MSRKAELILAEFPELRVRDGVVRYEGTHVADPEKLDERQLRAGAAIGLRRARDILLKRHEETLKEVSLERNLEQRRKLEEKAKWLLRLATETSDWECRYV